MEWVFVGNATPLVLTVGIIIGVLLRDAFDILKGVLRDFQRRRAARRSHYRC